jgi:protocatechuate 3,4-dioxygenase beta subunit/Ca2+-binding RTX toxin-like protein
VPGSDSIQVVAPSGSSFSPAGTSATLPDSTVSSTGTQAVTVTSGSSTVVNAGEYGGSTVSGTVFTDSNADGAKQSGDAGLAGQIVNLIGPDGKTVIATATTDANGNYSFSGIAPGADTIQVVAAPGDSFSPVGADSTVSASGTKAVTVTSGSNAVVNAGEYAPSTITGVLFTDSNDDGVQQSGETGLSGQTVNLIGPDGTTILATTTTGATGAYSFTGVAPGADTIQIVAPAGDRFSPAGTSTTLPDSTVSSTGTQAVTVTSGSSTVANGGVYAPGTITGSVFADSNADGTKQSGEGGLSGQTVNLIGPDGKTVIATTTTDASGNYSFAGVAPGADTIQVVAATGNSFSPAGADSSVSSTGTQAVTVTSGSSAVVNAGEYAPGTITGNVFADSNADGARQSGEAGVSGQTVNLIGPDGQTVIASTKTDASGNYSFTGVVPGADSIQVVAGAGTSFSPTGTSTTLPDSNVSAAGTKAVTITSGGSAVVNAGEYAPSTIGGTLFGDSNNDGVQQSGETGLAGQTVQLIGPDGVTVIATTTSSGTGAYSFSGIAPGTYTVQVVAPPGSNFSPVGGSTTLPDSTVSSTGAQGVTVTSGSATTVNAGEYAHGTIAGHVFQDQNGDGVQETGDANVAGVTVQLLTANGTPTGQTAVTDSNGAYSFNNLIPGIYQVKVTAPAGDGFSPKGGDANLAVDSAVDGTGTATVTLSSGGTLANVNAGVFQSASISSRVFVDGQGTGVYHVGDPGVPNVTVELLDAKGKPTGKTTTTDANGNYSFTNLTPGAYEVKFDLPGGMKITQLGTSADPSLNNEANPTTATTAATTILGTTTSNAFNAGVILTGTTDGTGQTEVPTGTGQSFNTGGQVIIGDGSNNIHTNQGDNVILVGPGSNVVETSPGNDIVFSGGSTNAQALGTTDYIFGGPGGGVLQGGSGSDYLVAGSGAYTLAGGAGPATLVSGPGGGTVTTTNGVVTGYTVGDEIRPAGGKTTIIYQKGDSVDLLDTFKPGHDTLTIYGYSGFTSTAVVTGHTVLYLGGNDAIVMNDAYDTANGTYPGITFVPGIPSVPTLVEYADANGKPTLGLPGSAPVVVTTPPTTPATNTATATASGATLTAGNDPTYTLVGGAGQNTLIGGTGADTILANGTGNTIKAGSGANTIVTGSGSDAVTAGDGANSIFTSSNGNSVFAGNGDNTVVLLQGASNNTVGLGSGANTVFAFGGTGVTITAGNGANTVFAQIDASNVSIGAGNAFIFGTGNNVTVVNPGGGVLSVNGANATTNAGNGDLTLFQTGGSVTTGTGNHAFYVTGSGVSISAGDGNNTVIGPNGNATVKLGNGTQLIGVGGTGNKITVGDGSNTIFAGSGNDTVTTGRGNNIVVISGSGSTITTGAGNTQIFSAGAGGNTYVAAGAPSGVENIYGFLASATGGDVLDLRQVLADMTGASAAAITATSSGNDTLVGVTIGGATTTIADLHGIGGLSLSQLTADHALRLS